MIITVDAVTKEPRVFNSQQQWGVKLVNGEWITLVCGFRPSKGQQFDVAIKENQGKDGRIFRTATIIAPAPAQTGQQQERQVDRSPTPSQPQPSPTGQLGPLNAKIPWEDWAIMTRAAHELACILEPDDQGEHICERSNARAALVNTVMIAFSNGKLETPIEAGPVSTTEPDPDDIGF